MSKRRTEFYLLALVIWTFIVIGICFKYADNAVEKAKIEVASGQIKCELVEQEDKTSKWECE